MNGDPGIFLDLSNIQWWQSVVAILGLLGLSPAPWILGLATGRIQFAGPAEKAYASRVEELKDGHARATAELVKYHDDIDAQWQRRYDELKLSRDGWKDQSEKESDRARLANEQTIAIGGEATKLVNNVLGTNHEGPKP